MKYIQKVLSRIEKDKVMSINFDYDAFSKKGANAIALGLVRWEGKWHVQVEFNLWEGAIDTMTLKQYMEKTHDYS